MQSRLNRLTCVWQRMIRARRCSNSACSLSSAWMAYFKPRRYSTRSRSLRGLRARSMADMADGGGMNRGSCCYGSCQSSTINPGTRRNSAVLCVTKVQMFAKEIAAIWTSYGPIIWPMDSK